LVHHIVTALSSLGCIKINLQVRSSNSAVVSFYESLGFKVEDRISMGLLLAGDTMTRFKAVYPISNEDMNALPVKEIGPAIAFYRTVLGFSVVASDSTSAVLKRDDVQIGLIRKADHDPLQAGSCYFAVSDVEALRRELEGKGAKPGATEIQEHDGKDYRLFFVRECDMMESHDGYCFCFGQPA
jgi:predicted lactoylglutathione lyase